jgi:hypothetical protein
MEIFKIIVQIFIAISIYNVWLIRVKKSTTWRGGSAKSMKEEFETYELPEILMYIVGFLKLCFATILLVGIMFPEIINIGAIGIAILMSGAVVMHLKVKDKLMKSLPAFSFLVLSLLLIFL